MLSVADELSVTASRRSYWVVKSVLADCEERHVYLESQYLELPQISLRTRLQCKTSLRGDSEAAFKRAV